MLILLQNNILCFMYGQCGAVLQTRFVFQDKTAHYLFIKIIWQYCQNKTQYVNKLTRGLIKARTLVILKICNVLRNKNFLDDWVNENISLQNCCM